MRKNKFQTGNNLEENVMRSKTASEGEHVVTDAVLVDHNKQSIMEESSIKDKVEKWALFISACGGIGFIPKEEAKALNLGPLGETRTIHNIPDAEGNVAMSIEVHTYEVYG